MSRKVVENFFLELARFYDIPISHQWKKALSDLLGDMVGLKNAGHLRTWIARGAIPRHAIENIKQLDIPTELKELADTLSKRKPLKKPITSEPNELHSVSAGALTPIESDMIMMFRRLPKQYQQKVFKYLNDHYVQFTEHQLEQD